MRSIRYLSEIESLRDIVSINLEMKSFVAGVMQEKYERPSVLVLRKRRDKPCLTRVKLADIHLECCRDEGTL